MDWKQIAELIGNFIAVASLFGALFIIFLLGHGWGF